jgi:hypothetical protein
MEKNKLPDTEAFGALLKERNLTEADLDLTCLRVATQDKRVFHWHYPGGSGGWEEVTR